MTHLYMRRDVYKSGGHDAAGRVAYIIRQPARATTQLGYITEGREDCVFATSRNLPRWCQGDPKVYFAAAERFEGVGWVAFEELKIGLPVEFSHRDNMALMHALIDAIAGDSLPTTYAFHAPTTMDRRQEQPHLHVILSRRETDAINRGATGHFRRYNRAHPERGGARKDPAFAERLVQRHLRVLIADIINVHLEHAGIEERVHPGNLQERGIDRTPEPKLLPAESRAYREKGIVSPRMQEVLTIRAERERTRADEHASAVEYWEARKDALGLTEGMDLLAQLTAVCTARAQVRDQTTEQRREQEAQRLHERGQEAADDAWRDAVLLWAEEQGARALRDVGWEAVQEAREEGHEALAAAWQERWLAAQARTWTSLEEDLQALARQLDALSSAEGGQGHVRIRLWEREREQGLGL